MCKFLLQIIMVFILLLMILLLHLLVIIKVYIRYFPGSDKHFTYNLIKKSYLIFTTIP
jgi:hypothetical protein